MSGCLTTSSLLLASLLALSPCSALAQTALDTGHVVSPELGADNKLTFHLYAPLYAPDAETVQLASSGDIPQIPFGQSMEISRSDKGLREQ